MLAVYQYPKCSTCRNALRWLDAHGIAYESIDIVSSPPSAAVLREVRKATGLPVAKLFNTSGQAYREGKFKDRVQTLDEGAALAELAANGKLIKRPLVVGSRLTLVGFDAKRYEESLPLLTAQ